MYRLISNLNGRPPATDDGIMAFETTWGMRVPEDFRKFLKIANGGEGYIGQIAYVILWGIEDLVSMNKAYEVEEYAPGLLMFGSDGGGDAYGFDTRNAEWPIVEMPFVGMDWSEAQTIATSFTDFLEYLSRVE